jgi:hypothetical protein
MEDSTSNMALLLEYARLLKSTRELQLRELDSVFFKASLVAAQTDVSTRAATHEIALFMSDPIRHPLTQVKHSAALCVSLPP